MVVQEVEVSVEVVVVLTEEDGEEEEVMDAEEEAWIGMEAMAGMGEVWVVLDLVTPDLETGSVSRQPVETPTLPGGKNATSAKHQREKIPEMQVKEEALVEEGEEEDTVVVVGADLEEAEVEDLGTEVEEVAASEETEVVVAALEAASEAIGEVVVEALVEEEVEVLVGIGVEGEVVLVTVVVGVEGSVVIGGGDP